MISRKTKAHDYIRDRILSNKIKPGTLLTELDLSEKLKMSRTPIREALRELEAEGLVESYPARGTAVTTLNRADVEEIYELRTLMELWALQKAFPLIQDAELDYLERQFTQAYQNQDWERLHKADRVLHKLIADRSGSKRLIAIIDTLNGQAERIRRISAQNPDRIEVSFREHLDIIRRIRSRDLDAALVALKTHLRSVSDSALQTAQVMNDSPIEEL